MKLGSFALGEVIATAATWGRAARDLPPPPRTWRSISPSGSSTIRACCRSSSRLAPERLVLEITEGVALVDIDSAVRVIERLRQLNVTVARDDFGTGYSSLSYLVRLGPRIIKIDRSFVSPGPRDSSAERVLGAIIQLCHERPVGWFQAWHPRCCVLRSYLASPFKNFTLRNIDRQ